MIVEYLLYITYGNSSKRSLLIPCRGSRIQREKILPVSGAYLHAVEIDSSLFIIVESVAGLSDDLASAYSVKCFISYFLYIAHWSVLLS